MLADSAPTAINSKQYTEYGIPIRNLWYMLLYAWNEYPITKQWLMEDVEDAPTLDALLAAILAKLVQQRLRIGLGHNYVNQSESIRGIRGRIDFAESLKRRSFEHGQVYCEYQQYSANAHKNQIIRSTLARLVQTGNFGPDHALANELRHRLRILTRALEGIDLIDLKLDFVRRQQFGRNDGDYRLMLKVCEIILLRQMPIEINGQKSLPTIDRGALALPYVYEKFVANFYRIHLQGWTVKPQTRLSWHAIHDNPHLPSMQPDLILEDNQSRNYIVLDTKFTANSLIDNQWRKPVFDSSHLYQLYAYLSTQADLSEIHRRASGILLYPAISHELSEKIELKDHIMRVECVDLAASWQDIEQQLLDLITGSR